MPRKVMRWWSNGIFYAMWQPREVETLRRLSVEGKSLRIAARLLRRTYGSVSSKAQSSGIRFDSKNPGTVSPQRDAIEAMILTGARYGDIGLQFGRSKSSICGYAYRMKGRKLPAVKKADSVTVTRGKPSLPRLTFLEVVRDE